MLLARCLAPAVVLLLAGILSGVLGVSVVASVACVAAIVAAWTGLGVALSRDLAAR